MLLKIAIGPPPGINIRNLTWHGFLSSNVFPENIVGTLFQLLLEVGNIRLKFSENEDIYLQYMNRDMHKWIKQKPYNIHCSILNGKIGNFPNSRFIKS